jgi:hypothetical protein
MKFPGHPISTGQTRRGFHKFYGNTGWHMRWCVEYGWIGAGETFKGVAVKLLRPTCLSLFKVFLAAWGLIIAYHWLIIE